MRVGSTPARGVDRLGGWFLDHTRDSVPTL
jgi:hypothetical protein